MRITWIVRGSSLHKIPQVLDVMYIDVRRVIELAGEVHGNSNLIRAYKIYLLVKLR